MNNKNKKKNTSMIIFSICLCLIVIGLSFLLGVILEKQGYHLAFADEIQSEKIQQKYMSQAYQSYVLESGDDRINDDSQTNVVNGNTKSENEVNDNGQTKVVNGNTKSENEAIKSTDLESQQDEIIDKINAILNDEVFPLLAGLVTGLMTILALIVPYVKTIGKLKSTQSAYATVYDEHEKLIGLAKEFDTENVKKDIVQYVVAQVEDRFIRYDKALGEVLGQEEIISAQLTSLVEGAKIAWSQAEGASIVLAKTPTATVVEKQALAIEFLKTLIANELGLKKEELESRMNKELSK